MKNFFLLALITVLYSTKAQNVDASGKKQGYWKKKDEKTNRLVYEGIFKDDKPIGRFKYYHPNDSVRAIIDFRANGKTAYARLFHATTGKRMAEGKYADKEVKDSVWAYYDEAGLILSREKYVTGKKEGPAYVYFPDGTVSEERHYKNDIQHGTFKQYFDVKRVRTQGNYVKGQLEGWACYYFPNGIEAAVGYYTGGLKNGPWVYKTKDGKIKEKELYINGQQASKKETETFFSKNKNARAAPARINNVTKKNSNQQRKIK